MKRRKNEKEKNKGIGGEKMIGVAQNEYLD